MKKNNLILTWSSNINSQNWSQYEVYFKSIQRLNLKNCDFVCLTDNMDHDYVDQIVKNFNFQIYFVKPRTKRLFTERWFAYWEYLVCRSFENIFISDSRDVLLQKEPFNFIPDSKEIVLSQEGFLHKDSQFNMTDQFNLQREIQDNFETFVNWPVVNAGIVLGRYKSILDFCFLMWSNCVSHGKCTDQAVLNFMMSKLCKDDKYYFSNPNYDTFCLTGEVFKENFLTFEPLMQDGKIKNQNQNIFTVFHQWDRTKFADSILNLFIK